MWDAVRDDNDISFGDLTCLAVADAASAEFISRNFFRVEGFTTGHECCTAIEYVDHVSVFGMDLRLAGFFPPAGVDHVIACVASVEQDGTFGESRVNLVLFKIGDWSRIDHGTG